MNSRVGPIENNRDAHVVEEICGYITERPPRSFFLFAGAGSGKTRTLVETLRRMTGLVEHEKGEQFAQKLRSRGQSIRIITYTKNAANVIAGRLGENYLADVSTIHTFCWELIKGYDTDIREALLSLNTEKLSEAKAKAKSKVKGESSADQMKYAALDVTASEIRETEAFKYHPDKNTYGEGALSHTDVINVAAWLISNRPTLQHILVDRHPLILIDESQDTMKGILDALFNLANIRSRPFTLGLIGDHRQRIYADGHDNLPSHVPSEWARPVLLMNHRSQRRIVELINNVWGSAIDGRTQSRSDLAQEPRTEKNGGTVRIFVGDTQTTIAEKIRTEANCALNMASATSNPAWQENKRCYKTLALEHSLAAKRGDFFKVYSAMELLDKDAAKPKSNGDRTGPAMVRPILGPLPDLAECIQADGSLNEFSVMSLLRRNGVLGNLPQSSTDRQLALESIHQALMKFVSTTSKDGASVREVLATVLDKGLFEADIRLMQAYNDRSPPPSEPKVKSREAAEDRSKRGWHLLFNSPWREIAKYRAYLGGEAELATHQVVKGSEFEHVMVVMDDEEAGGFLFSYDKLFGAEALSDNDRARVERGEETTIDRTLRLLYVTCSRAEESLALVLWSKDPKAALLAISRSNWFDASEVKIL